MRTLIVSYSFTGNNQAMAAKLARELSAEHVQIRETGKRSMGKIVTDTLLNRNPRIEMPAIDVAPDDLVIFVAPIWMGKIAAPMRQVFLTLKERDFRYGFISLSGGADGPDSNDQIAGELAERLGREPLFQLDLHKAALLPAEPKPTRDMTMNYQVTSADISSLMDPIRTAFRQVRGFEGLLA